MEPWVWWGECVVAGPLMEPFGVGGNEIIGGSDAVGNGTLYNSNCNEFDELSELLHKLFWRLFLEWTFIPLLSEDELTKDNPLVWDKIDARLDVVCCESTDGLLDACCDKMDALLELCVGENSLNEPLLPGKIGLLVLLKEGFSVDWVVIWLIIFDNNPAGCEARLSLEIVCVIFLISVNEPKTDEDLLWLFSVSQCEGLKLLDSIGKFGGVG